MYIVLHCNSMSSAIARNTGHLSQEANATATKKFMEIENFRKISPDQLVEVRMCNRFMLN